MITKSTRRLPLNKIIVVDIDGTLIVNSQVDEDLLEWCRIKRAEGFTLILWSLRGQAYAQRVADRAKANDIFHHVIGKPGYIVDNEGWKWTRFTRRITKWIPRLKKES